MGLGHKSSWVLRLEPSLSSGTFSSRSVIWAIYYAEILMRRHCPQTGTVVRITAIVTQLVFEHALRIRMKAETSSSPVATPTATPEGRSEVTTPDSGSVVDINIVSEDAAGGSSEETRSEQSTTTASTLKGKRKEEAPGSNSGKEVGDESGGSSNLVGKTNNLVSTDMENLIDGRDFLLFG
jgi:hypothetical protein